MNLFLRELRSQFKPMIYWALGILLMVAGGMGKYAAYSEAGESVNELFKAMPESFRVIFGISSFDLNTAKGFYAMLYLYLIIMAGIHASLLGAELIRKEERDHTAEFLLVKPMTRTKVSFIKCAAGIVQLLLFNLLTLVTSVGMFSKVSKGETLGSEILLLMFGMLLLQLFFYALGFGLAGTARFSKASGGLASGLMFVSFLVSVASDLNPDIPLIANLSPFHLLSAEALLGDMSVSAYALIYCLGAACLFIAIGITRFNRRDLNH